MSADSQRTAAFRELRAILQPYAAHLDVVQDTASSYYLDTRFVMKNKKPLFFGAVRAGKSYVSFHLMPVYTCPALLERISPALEKRRQGKSCFNFAEPDAPLFAELRELTRAGFEHFQRESFI